MESQSSLPPLSARRWWANRVRWLARAGACWLALAALPGIADTTRTQTIQLARGWNAVFLEVYPLEANPAIVFGEVPVDVVASFYSGASTAQFIGNPNADLFRKGGWGVWYADSRPDKFLRSLHSIHGQQAYLIHAKADCTLAVTGGAVPASISWVPNAYNFVGFSVRASGAPTFAQFFRGSPAHQHNKIYRLENGNWRRVLDPTAEAMRAGEAFWVYCDGASKYQGPLALETAAGGSLVLGDDGMELILRNLADHPLTPTVHHVLSGTNCVPISIQVQVVGGTNSVIQFYSAAKPDAAWSQAVPPMEASASTRIPFEARREDMRAAVQSSLLKITTDLGTEAWLPVVATRKDLEEQ